MSTPMRIAAFVVGLTAVFGLALGVGNLVDPDTDPDTAPAAEPESDSHETGGHADHEATAAAAPVHVALTDRSFAPGAEVPVSFQLQDDHGDPETAFDVEHEKELHLIVLGTRDLTDFQHVHPTRAADGTWSVPLKLAPGTSYRLYADGSTGGAAFLATADIFTTGGQPAPRPAPEPSTRDQVDGLTVDLDEADGASTLEVTRDGQPVKLEPYLGVRGHLVVIRVDDLSYLHVHPQADDAPVFSVSGLAPGRYRYFFDFQVDGVVHTAAFTHDIDAAMTMDMEGDGHDSH